jgi:hypothetical protein
VRVSLLGGDAVVPEAHLLADKVRQTERKMLHGGLRSEVGLGRGFRAHYLRRIDVPPALSQAEGRPGSWVGLDEFCRRDYGLVGTLEVNFKGRVVVTFVPAAQPADVIGMQGDR